MPPIPFPPHDTVPLNSAAMTANAAKTNKPVNRNVRMFFPFLIMVKQSVYCYKEKVYWKTQNAISRQQYS
jgi:hypothetical protein